MWTVVEPGVDAYRVASLLGRGTDLTEARLVLTGAKSIELVFESLPGTVIQAMALFAGRNLSLAPVTSLLSSILTTSCIATQMAHEWDVAEENCEAVP